VPQHGVRGDAQSPVANCSTVPISSTMPVNISRFVLSLLAAGARQRERDGNAHAGATESRRNPALIRTVTVGLGISPSRPTTMVLWRVRGLYRR
jgi:hypothetical protein